MRPLLILTSVLALALLTPGCSSSRTLDAPPEPATAQAPRGAGGPHGGRHMGQGRVSEGRMGQGRMAGSPGGEGRMGGGRNGDMGVIHSLLADHAAIERRVEDLPNGVETWTESDDPEVATRIREHVRQMDARLAEGRPMRRWDPLFAEIFEHADAIAMEIEDTPRGVRVVETSDDPYVVALIRQHARRAVSEFVEGGMERAHQPTPLPDTPPASAPAARAPAGSASRPSLPAFDDARFTTAPLWDGAAQVTGFALRAGQALPEHAVPADAFLLVTEGRIVATVGGEAHALGAGEGIELPGGVPHAVRAEADTRMVLVRPQ